MSKKAAAHRRATPDRIAESLRGAILRGDIAPGEKLVQDEIAARFGVSRIPVRDALRHLVAEGLVTFDLRRGATVQRLSAGEAEELLEIRFLLESHAMRAALPRLDDGALRRAQAILDEAERTPDIDRWSELNWAFHRSLYEPAAKQRLVRLIQNLSLQIDPVTRLLISNSDYRPQAQAEHRAILAACAVRNEAAVVHLLRQHLDETASSLKRFLTGAQR